MRTRCECGGSCLLPIIAGIIAGVLGVVFATTFTAITTFLWITFGVALGVLVLLTGIITVTSLVKREDTFCCVCDYGKCLLVSIFGTIITSTIALAVGTLTGTLGTILGFLVVGFFFWLLVAFLLFLICIINRLCD